MKKCTGGGGGGTERKKNKNRQTGTEGGADEASAECIQLLFESSSADLDPTQQSHYAA